MDPRRLLTAGACAAALCTGLGGCSTVGGLLEREEATAPAAALPPTPPVAIAPEAPRFTGMAPIPNPPARARGRRAPEASPAAVRATTTATPAPAPLVALAAPDDRSGNPTSAAALSTAADAADADAPPAPRPASRAPRGRNRPEPVATPALPASGRAAIAEANARARAASTADAFENGVQVFAFEPGRLYEVWTAPYRVTTLSLAPGETVVSKAAGDTVRWQIGETTSGTGAEQRTHVLVKPLERGLETNLVLTTSHRVYMILLRSGADDAFNAAVAWRYPGASPAVAAPLPEPAVAAIDPARLDDRYRIEPRMGLTGRRPRWTPTAVFNDGARTFITLPVETNVDEAPVLFVLAPDGEAQVVNYRQQGGMLVVDRVFDRAELRLGGDRRPQIVRISRAPERRAAR